MSEAIIMNFMILFLLTSMKCLFFVVGENALENIIFG